MNWYVAGASFLGSAVEFVEALTIVLAVLLTKGWRTAVAGALGAVALLTVLVFVIGFPLVHVIQLAIVQFIVGCLMLLFGMRWLRKAILRFAGYKAIHNESVAFSKEMERQRTHARTGSGIDKFGALTAFSGVFLEGLEAVFIVITVGLSGRSLGSATISAAAALVAVLVTGAVFRGPLQAVPENMLKFIVGVMVSSFGTFWAGEGLGVLWIGKDASILAVIAFYAVASAVVIIALRRRRKVQVTASSSHAG